MAYSLDNLTGGEYKERLKPGTIPQEQMSALDMDDNMLGYIVRNFHPLKSLGIEIGEDGSVPVSDGAPRIFVLQTGEDGIDRMKSLDELGVKYGSRECWQIAQSGNLFAYPAGSSDPVQINARITKGNAPQIRVSAPLDIEDIHKTPANHEYREPGIITRFINRFVKSYRKTDCDIYRERQKFADIAARREKGKTAEMKELREAEKRYEEKTQHERDVENHRRLSKTTGYKAYGKQFYKDMVLPTPKHRPEHERDDAKQTFGFYSKEEFNSLEKLNNKLEDYSVGGQPISEDEYCGLVMICSQDPKFAEAGFKKTTEYDDTLHDTLVFNGFSEKEASRVLMSSYGTMVADDLMKGDLRNNQGAMLDCNVNPGRKMAFDVLEEYKKGNKQPLADKIAEGILSAVSTSDEYTTVPNDGAFNRMEFAAATADLMDRDPELKDLVMNNEEIDENDVSVIKGMREYSKADSARNTAKTAIAKALAEGRELSEIDKLNYARDIVKANIIESRLFAENTAKNREGREIDKETDRLKKLADDNNLVPTEKDKLKWKQVPKSRPLPPKGMYYKDQVIHIMNGRKIDYIDHPDLLVEAGDPKNIEDIDTLADSVVNKDGLSGLSTRDLMNTLNKNGSKYTGVKLIEEVGKIAQQKVSGKNAPEADKALDPLNTAVNYGHKAPKNHKQEEPQAGVPVA